MHGQQNIKICYMYVNISTEGSHCYVCVATLHPNIALCLRCGSKLTFDSVLTRRLDILKAFGTPSLWSEIISDV